MIKVIQWLKISQTIADQDLPFEKMGHAGYTIFKFRREDKYRGMGVTILSNFCTVLEFLSKVRKNHIFQLSKLEK